MKIAYINMSQVPSSTANSIQVMKVCQALARTSGETMLWVNGGHEVPWRELAQHYGLSTPFDVRWLHANRLLRGWDFAWSALRQARAWGAGVVYTRILQVAVLALWLNLPVIYEIHLLPSGTSGPLLFREFLRKPGKKRLLVITHAMQRLLEEQFHLSIPPELVQVAPSGVDLERFNDLPEPVLARAQFKLPEQPTAMYTGHFYAGRGLDLLFSLAQRMPQVHFLWIGGKPEDVGPWQAKLDKAGMTNVTLTGFVDNRRLPLYQAAADVLLMPYERVIRVSSGTNTADFASPIKMFDYMASGRVLVTSDLPVLREVLNEGNAVFCPPEDVDAWQQAIAALLADPDRRAALAAQARRDVERFTWDNRTRRALEGF